MADTYNMAIIGSMMVRDKGVLYNRGFIFRPGDTPQYYDKHHLYASGGEAEFFSPGNKRTLFDFRGVKIRLAVCYDLRFPVWLRQDNPNSILGCPIAGAGGGESLLCRGCEYDRNGRSADGLYRPFGGIRYVVERRSWF